MTSVREGVAEVVQRLHDEYGEVRASQLVDAARHPASHAHDGFEWDDDKASEQYRLIQARQWLREVHIIVENKSQPLWHVPSVTGEDGREGVYKAETIVVTIADEAARALEQLTALLRNAEENVNRFQRAIERNPTKASKAKVAKMKRGLGIMQDAVASRRRPARRVKAGTSRVRKVR